MISEEFQKLKTNNRGSALVLTMIILVNALLIVAAIASISIVERKASSRARNSTPAFQAADSAVEWMLKKIKSADPTSEVGDSHICSSFNSTTGLCIPDGLSLSNSADVEIFFVDTSGAIITDPSASIYDIRLLRAIGRFGSGDEKVSRALEVSVQESGAKIEDDSDIMILVDYSNSVSADPVKFGLLKDAVKDFIGNLAAIPGSDHQIGLAIFADSVDVQGLVDISDPVNVANLENFIDSSAVLPSGTNTFEALDEAYNELLVGTNSRHGSNPQAVVMITDGAPNYSSVAGCRDNTAMCTTAPSYWDVCGANDVSIVSDDIKNDGIIIISIGVGINDLASVDCSQKANDLLGQVASAPSWYFSLDDFSDLIDILESLE